MSQIYYRIIDEHGNFVDKYAFQCIPQGKGKKPKWYYFSYQGYVSGSILYPTPDGNILELLGYLKTTSSQLGLHKDFTVVPYYVDDIPPFSEAIIEEVIVRGGTE